MHHMLSIGLHFLCYISSEIYDNSFEETLDAIKVTIVLKLPQNQKFEMKLNFQVIQNHA